MIYLLALVSGLASRELMWPWYGRSVRQAYLVWLYMPVTTGCLTSVNNLFIDVLRA